MNAVFVPPRLFLEQPWVERLGWTLLHFLWQGVLIAKLFAAGRALAGKSLSPNARYRFACGSLAAMTLAPIVTFWLIGTGSALIPADASAWSARPFATAYSSAVHVAVDGWRLNLPSLSREVLPWIVVAWMCGVAAFSLRLAGGLAFAARLRSAGSARPAAREWQERLAELIARLRISRPVRLLESSLAQAPAVVGLLRPAILMPVGALAGLPVEQIEALLAHELAHIRRHDYLINLLQSAVEALLFYHPSVWWLSNEIRAERELCCDDAAVEVTGDALTYASALAAVEAERPARLRAAMAANGGSLVTRIQRLLEPAEPMSHAQPSPGAAAALAILLAAGIGAAAMDRSSGPAPVAPVAPVRASAAQAPVAALPTLPEPTAKTVTHRSRASKPRTEAHVERSPEPAQEQAQALAPPQRYEREMANRYRFGNSEVRTWASVEGEPVLRGIEFRGMTRESAEEVLSRLPISEGQRVSHAAREQIGEVMSEYGRSLEFGLTPDGDGGAVLRIHPPGFANAEQVRLEPRGK